MQFQIVCIEIRVDMHARGARSYTLNYEKNV
jgi:hypothetical protein